MTGRVCNQFGRQYLDVDVDGHMDYPIDRMSGLYFQRLDRIYPKEMVLDFLIYRTTAYAKESKQVVAFQLKGC